MDFIAEIKTMIQARKTIEAQSLVHSQFGRDRHLTQMQVSKALCRGVLDPLFESEDGAFFIDSNRENWDFDYWIETRSQLRDNFSAEKLKHCIDIMDYLREQGNPRFIPTIQEKKSVKRREEVKNPGFIERILQGKNKKQ